MLARQREGHRFLLTWLQENLFEISQKLDWIAVLTSVGRLEVEEDRITARRITCTAVSRLMKLHRITDDAVIIC